MESLQDWNREPQAAPHPASALGLSPFATRPSGESPLPELFEDGPLNLHVHLLYEDAPTAARATKLVENLSNQLKLEADFHLTSTLFDTLREPRRWELITSEAGGAHILFLSAHGRRDFGLGVVAWIAEWLKCQCDGPRALVLSLDTEAEGSPLAAQLLDYVRRAAQRSGVDVFWHFGEPSSSSHGLSREDIQYRAEAKTALLEETLFRIKPSSHWGINE